MTPRTVVPPDQEPEWALLDRHFAGESTPAERERLERWMAADEARAAVVQEARAIWAASAGAPVRFSADRAWTTTQERMADRVSPAAHPWSWMKPWPVVGAALAAVVAIGWVAMHRTANRSFQEFASIPGQQRTLTLQDGTRVILAPDSRLRIPVKFGSATRQVELSGEAYFAVAHNAVHPFAVRTARAVVQDVGTVFVVRDYSDDEAERVTVQEGEVSLQVAHRSAALLPGDLATIADTAVAVEHSARTAILTAWLQGGFVFNETPLRTVVRDISRTFGIKITVTDTTLLSKRVTATLSNEPLDVVLDVVTQVVGAASERTVHGVVIRRVNATLRPPLPVVHPLLTTVRTGDLH